MKQLQYVKYKVEILMGLIILVLLIFFCIQCERSKNANSKIKIFTQNEQALKKELKTNLNKDKELYTQSAVYVAENEELQKVNKELATEIKKYKDEVLYLSKVLISYKKKKLIDSNNIEKAASLVIDTTFIYSDTVVKIGCKVRVSDVEQSLKVFCGVEWYELELPLYVGLSEDKQDIFNTFVRSSNSSVNFDIFSTMRPDLFLRSASCSNYGVGIYFGGGLQSNFTTDVKVGLSVGLCIYYSLFNF